MAQGRARRRLAGLGALCLITMGLAVLPAQPAAAATINWSRNLTADVQMPERLMTHADGSVTAAGGCSSSPTSTPGYSTVTINAAGHMVQSLQKYINGSASTPWIKACDDQGAAGSDETLYATETQDQASWPFTRSVGLVAYKNGVRKWGRTAYDVCPSGQRNGTPRWVSVGADGDVYAIYAGACRNGNDRLIGITASTGAIKFNVQLTSNFETRSPFVSHLAVYNGGLLVLDGNQLRYFSYAGVEDTGKQYTFSVASGEYINLGAASAGGKYYVSIHRNFGSSPPDPCGANNAKTKRLVAHDTAGTTTTFDLTSYCTAVTMMRPLSDGGVAIQDTQSAGSYQSSVVRRFASDTSLAYDVSVTQRTGFGSFWASWIQADSSGKVYVPVAATATSGEPDRHVWVARIDATGTIDIVFSTEQLQTTGVTEAFRFTASENGLGSDAYYLSICKASTCSSSAPPTLYRIEVSGAGMDYPRGAVLPASMSLTYVALGDSYASALGTGPYYPGTEVSGGNQCRRSPKAYALQLAAIANLDLISFPACAGAVTGNINVTGLYDEPKQVDVLPDDVDVVTLQIGGNDIDFAGTATTCTRDGAVACEAALENSKALAESSTFATHLASAFTAVGGKTPQKVIVIGYANFMKKGDGSYCDWTGFPGVMTRSPSTTEQTLIEGVTDALNAAVATAAGNAGFEFASVEAAFSGHAWCESTPYVGGVQLLELGASYHPTVNGQLAIAGLVEAEL